MTAELPGQPVQRGLQESRVPQERAEQRPRGRQVQGVRKALQVRRRLGQPEPEARVPSRALPGLRVQPTPEAVRCERSTGCHPSTAVDLDRRCTNRLELT
jgi:hypothetical protein